MPPKKRGRKTKVGAEATGPAAEATEAAEAAEAAQAAAPEATPPRIDPSGNIAGPLSCDECERIRQTELRGFLAWSCNVCGLPVWFRTAARRREYAELSYTADTDADTDPEEPADQFAPEADAE